MTELLSNRPSAAPTGYVRISRELEDHPVVGFGQPVKPADPSKGSYSRGEAWIFLVFQARWKTAEVQNRGKVITLERGELLGARGFLAKAWNWTEDQVRGFLNKLESEMMIDRKNPQSILQPNPQSGTQKPAHFANVISIRNYSVYQIAIEQFCEEKAQSNTFNFTGNKPSQFPNHPPQIKEGKESKITTLEKHNLGLAPLENGAQNHDLFWDETGVVRACNGARQPLEQLIGGAATLDVVLRDISPKIPDKPTGKALLIAVTAAVVEHARDLNKARQRRGTRLPRDWKLPKSWGEWAMADAAMPDSWVRTEAAKFRDYWVGVPSSKGTKLDWQATWRNWVRAAGRPHALQRGMPDSNLLSRPADIPDSIWQNRLKQLVSEGRATRDQAIAAGLKPC